MMGEVLRDFWGVVLSGIAFIVWLVRLESRGLAHDREFIRIDERRQEDLSAAKEDREARNEMLAEIRRDVKSLLRGKD